MERYKRFSDEQIAVANQVDLVEYLRHQGETLTKAGKDMRWSRYTSVVNSKIDLKKKWKIKFIKSGILS